MKNKEKFHERANIYYSSIVNAFIENGMERDKQLLNISVLAIGAIIAFLNPTEKSSNAPLLFVASFCFIIVIIIILNLFKINQDYLEAVKDITEDNIDQKVIGERTTKVTDTLENKMHKLDKWVSILFVTGIIMLVAFTFFNFYNVNILTLLQSKITSLCQLECN